MPFDEIGSATVSSGGRVYLSSAGAAQGMTYAVAVNEDGDILLTTRSTHRVRPSTTEVAEALEATRRGRLLGEELAAEPTERGQAAAKMLRRLQVDPEIDEHLRGIVVGAALAQIDIELDTRLSPE